MTPPTSTPRAVELGPDDARRIVALEERCFIPSLRASEATVLRRFELGHTMLGVKAGDELRALVSFSYGRFDPTDPKAFPGSLEELCLQEVPDDYDTVFVYNLEVHPGERGGRIAGVLVRETLDRAERDGCTYGVANCRIPSYAGAEGIGRRPAFTAAIDRYLEGGEFPDQREFTRDPTLALYRRLTGCRFLWILPGYVPTDRASGGHRVIAYGPLRERVRRNEPTLESPDPSTATPADPRLRNAS